MTINRAFAPTAFLPLAATLALSACDGAVPRATERQPTHQAPVAVTAPLPPRTPSAPRPAVPPAPRATAPGTDWRDAPMPAGNWVWSGHASGSAARFGADGQPPVAVLQCDRADGQVRLAVPIDAQAAQYPGARAASITTSTSTGAATAKPGTIDGQTMLTIALPAGDRMLDAMAFSRGRFRVTITGMAPVILPSWAEVGRVVEDCRG